MRAEGFVGFTTWLAVLQYAQSGRPLYYHAPLDPQPRRIHVSALYKNGKLRIAKPSADADGFTADAGHLERFRKPADWYCTDPTDGGDLMGPNDPVTLTRHELELFAYHVSCLFRDRGRFGLSCKAGIKADVEIVPSTLSETDGTIWDSVTINGKSCGNRCGGAKAYARMVAGDPEWWRAE